jgi:hypothetical protein
LPPREIELLREKLRDTGDLVRGVVLPTDDLSPRGVVLPTDDLSPRGVVLPLPRGVVLPSPRGVVLPSPRGVVLPVPPLPKIAFIMRVVIDSLRNVSMASEEPPAVMVVCFVWNASERRSRNARQV